MAVNKSFPARCLNLKIVKLRNFDKVGLLKKGTSKSIRLISPKFEFLEESNLEWKDDFYFVQAADTQYGQFERLGMVDRKTLPAGKKAWYKELELSEKAVSLINQLQPKPKFMVGMLFNGLRTSSFELI